IATLSANQPRRTRQRSPRQPARVSRVSSRPLESTWELAVRARIPDSSAPAGGWLRRRARSGVRPVVTRGAAEDGGEGFDEARGVGPAAARRGVGDRVAVGEQDQGEVEAELGPPLAEAHAELLVEEAGQGPLAGADPAPELDQGRVVC